MKRAVGLSVARPVATAARAFAAPPDGAGLVVIDTHLSRLAGSFSWASLKQEHVVCGAVDGPPAVGVGMLPERARDGPGRAGGYQHALAAGGRDRRSSRVTALGGRGGPRRAGVIQWAFRP